MYRLARLVYITLKSLLCSPGYCLPFLFLPPLKSHMYISTDCIHSVCMLVMRAIFYHVHFLNHDSIANKLAFSCEFSMVLIICSIDIKTVD